MSQADPMKMRGNITKVASDEASSRVVEHYDGRHSYVDCIPSRFGDEAT